MFPAILSLSAALAILTTPLPKTTNPSAARAPVQAAPQKFYVYGGHCSRSIKLQGTYDRLEAAFAAAEKHRAKDEMKHITVRTGAHDRDYFGDRATHYKVYRRRPRCGGWLLEATVDNAASARELAAKLKTAATPTEIVAHYVAQ